MIQLLDKWNRHYQNADFSLATPARVLRENIHLLAVPGRALDLACGLAGNAIFLEKQGFQVDAIDSSSLLIQKLKQYINRNQLNINPILQDIETQPLLSSHYDVIVVSYFLSREIFPNIIDALTPGGLLVYQTWSQERVSDKGPKRQAFRLAKGELLTLCKNLQLVYYREDEMIGDISKGFRDKVFYIGKRC